MKHRFEVLDIFRGIFASMVVFYHLYPFADTPVINNEFVHNSDLFVDFFFVLSGFVITYTHQHMSGPGDMRLFYKKRFLRLYPLHLTLLLMFLIVEAGKHAFAGHIQVNHLDSNNTPLTFIYSLLLLNSVKLPGVHDLNWNFPSWSISAEMISYVIFGVVVWLVHRLQIYKARNYVFAAIVIAAFGLLYTITGSPLLIYNFDYGFLRGCIGFFIGALCFNTFSSTREKVMLFKPAFFKLAEIVVIAAMIVMVYNGATLKQYGFVYEALFFCAIYIFAFEKGVLSILFKRSGFLKKIGTYSYSIYMVHALLLSLFNIAFIRVLKLPPSAYSYLFIVNYALIYLVSAWTYKHIELKFQWKKKKLLTTAT